MHIFGPVSPCVRVNCWYRCYHCSYYAATTTVITARIVPVFPNRCYHRPYRGRIPQPLLPPPVLAVTRSRVRESRVKRGSEDEQVTKEAETVTESKKRLGYVIQTEVRDVTISK